MTKFKIITEGCVEVLNEPVSRVEIRRDRSIDDCVICFCFWSGEVERSIVLASDTDLAHHGRPLTEERELTRKLSELLCLCHDDPVLFISGADDVIRAHVRSEKYQLSKMNIAFIRTALESFNSNFEKSGSKF